MRMETMLFIGGLLHFSLVPAASLMPKVLNWRTRLACLGPFMQRLVWVYFCFIGMVIVGIGTLTVVFTEELASGTPLARALCGFVAVFWLARLGVQMFVFDFPEEVRSRFLKTGYHALTAVFVYLASIYALAAWLA